jgi:DNA-directed RNA polymerase subunit H (RpoH/RPB5)
MSNSTTNKIITIYKSRTTILELLKKQEYETGDYNSFNINEIDAMISTNQLDMLVSKTETDENQSVITTVGSNLKKIYVKYYLDSKQLRTPVLDDIIEDLFDLNGGTTATLEKKDTLVIITENEPNDSIVSRITYLYEKEGIFVVMFNIKRLQFNILNHSLVPPIHILNETERIQFMKKYNIKNLTKIPEIGRFDPQAQAVFLRPGDICSFERNSVSALKYYYYRVCV